MADTDEPICRICHGGAEDGKLFSPCKCSGSIKFVHMECLNKWREQSCNPQSFLICDSCKFKYRLQRPYISMLIQSDKVVNTLTILSVASITIGSGTGITFLFGEKWEPKNCFLYGITFFGLYGLAPQLPFIFREILLNYWDKVFFESGAFFPIAGIVLLAGAAGATSNTYMQIKRMCRLLSKKLGERILEVR